MTGRRAEDRWWLAAVAVLAATLGLWIDLTPIHRHHNADSIVQILASLVHWTPFFWEQNRFGQLVPLLALPIENPWHNLLFQVWLRLLALAASFFLLARVAVPRPWWPAVGGAALGCFLLAKSPAHQTYLLAQPYFQAMALALGGVLLIDSGRRAQRIAGSVLVAIAFWVSLATLFWLLPLLLLRRLLGLERTDRGSYVFLLTGACFAASLAASALDALFGFGGTDLGPSPVADWPKAWLGLGEGALRYLSPRWAAGVGLTLCAVAVLALSGRRFGSWRRRARPALAAGLCLLGTALGEIAALGTSGWIHLMQYDSRFIVSGLIALIVAGPALVLTLLLEETTPLWRRTANALALVALLPITFLRYGPPSPTGARQALDAGLGRHSAEIIASGGTHVIGNFWRVWPAVFHANLALFERGESRRVWGLTFRSLPTRALWNRPDWGSARFAALGSEEEIEAYRERFGIPRLFRKADLGRVEIYSALPPAVPALRTASLPPVASPGTPRHAGSPAPPLAFYTLRPCRLFDSFQGEPLASGDPPLRIPVAGEGCGIPSGARAIAVNVQAILPPCAGRLVLFPADRARGRPTSNDPPHPAPPLATLGFAGGETVANFQIVPLSEDGDLAAAATLEDG
ncbi:MAG TPA: hypothetical protein VJ885_02615, partial [Thermoanaerobaculia bacterium]|nr:hypothetical protein [Thermoanaerobaculia bacterium]